jgi:hypothetical protein
MIDIFWAYSVSSGIPLIGEATSAPGATSHIIDLVWLYRSPIPLEKKVFLLI